MLTKYQIEVLKDTPRRATGFLRGIATRVEIRAPMTEVGYTQAEHDYGWDLLLKASGYRPEKLPAGQDQKVRAAIEELDDWDEPGFRRIDAALTRLHPEQREFVFAGLTPARGAAAVVSVATLLDRLDALESAPERKATRKADQAAIATLSARGITPEFRAHLRGLVKTVQTVMVPEPIPEEPMSEDRLRDLTELQAWYKDWAETARAVIERRDYLVSLGLAKRRRSKAGDEENGDDEVSAPEPAEGAGASEAGASQAGPSQTGPSAEASVSAAGSSEA